jgi:hypothetical protein
MIDRVPLSETKVSLQVEFVSTDSKWKQGIALQTKGDFEVNGQKLHNKIVLWEHTTPRQVEIVVKSKDNTLVIYNVWETEDGTVHYWHNGGAFFTEQANGTTIYYCNDGVADDDFDDLIFKIGYH